MNASADPAYVMREWTENALGMTFRSYSQRIEKRGGSTLVWIRADDKRFILKQGGRTGDAGMDWRGVAPRVWRAEWVDGELWRLLDDLTATHKPFIDRPDAKAAGELFARVHQPLEANQTIPFDPTEMLWDVAERHWPVFAEVKKIGPEDRKAFERLLETRPQRPGFPVRCHGDAHGGNLLVSEGGEAVLIDWEDSRVGPGAEDLAFFLGDLPAELRLQVQPSLLLAYGGIPADDFRAALNQLPKMPVFWHANNPEDPEVDRALSQSWRFWRAGAS